MIMAGSAGGNGLARPDYLLYLSQNTPALVEFLPMIFYFNGEEKIKIRLNSVDPQILELSLAKSNLCISKHNNYHSNVESKQLTPTTVPPII